jgi:thiamine-phosphate pyrophosphorylase
VKRLRGLYAITPEEPDDQRLLSRVEPVLEAGPALLQYRAKDLAPGRRRDQAQALLARCRAHGVPLIVNDDVGLAQAIGADGVHLGRDDAEPAAARARLGADAIIGVSCYDSLERARQAAAAGADYAAFGSMYATPRKPLAPRASLGLLAQARDLPLAVCAIGGITLARAPRLLAAGADLLAVIGDLFDGDRPKAIARAYAALFGDAARS